MARVVYLWPRYSYPGTDGRPSHGHSAANDTASSICHYHWTNICWLSIFNVRQA